jgi:hypothetical protein
MRSDGEREKFDMCAAPISRSCGVLGLKTGSHGCALYIYRCSVAPSKSDRAFERCIDSTETCSLHLLRSLSSCVTHGTHSVHEHVPPPTFTHHTNMSYLSGVICLVLGVVLGVYLHPKISWPRMSVSAAIHTVAHSYHTRAHPLRP